MSNEEKNKKPSVSLKITKAILKSGFLAELKPQEFQTLIALCSFADYKGRLKVSCKSLAQALSLSEKQAQLRLKRVCNLRWHGKPLLIKEPCKVKFAPNEYRLLLPYGLMLIQEGELQRKSMSSEAEREKGLPSSEAKGSPLPEAEVSYNNNVVVNNIYNKATTNNKERLLELLKIEGVTESIARELVEKYPHEQITAQLKMLPYRKALNPAGLLVKAIKGNWAPPQAYQGMKELSAQRAIKKAEEEKIAREEARKRARWQKIKEVKARMSQKEITKLRERAKEKIPQILKSAYSKKNLPLPEILIEAEVNHIIATEYLKK